MASRVVPAEPAAADPTAWPVLWARCWVQVRSWRVPPRWSADDWCDEACAEVQWPMPRPATTSTPVAACPWTPSATVAWLTPSEPATARSGPDGLLAGSGVAIPDLPAPTLPGLDPDTLESLVSALDNLAALDRSLIRQLFWDGRREHDLAREWGVSQQAVSKRKQKILQELRRQVGTL